MNSSQLDYLASTVDQAQLRELLIRIVNACADLAIGCSNNHAVGLADFDGKGEQKEISLAISDLGVLNTYISDYELQKNIVILQNMLQGLLRIDINITSVYSIPSPK